MSEQQATAAAPVEDPEQMVLYDVVEPHIAKITLNRPHRRNAILTPEMNRILMERFEQAQDDDDIKCIVLTGAGSDFCSGEDVARTPVETFGLKRGDRLPQSRRIRGISRTHSNLNILKCDKVVIAAVQGGAYGLGFNIALCCDLIVAAEGAKFARRQTRIGFGTFDMALPLVMLKLGINRGYEVIITGRTIEAEELKDWGAVTAIVPLENLEAEALRYAKAVANHSTDGLMIGRQAKKLFWNSMGMPQWEVFLNIGHPLFTNLVWREDEANLYKERSRTNSHREALDAVYKRWDDLGFH